MKILMKKETKRIIWVLLRLIPVRLPFLFHLLNSLLVSTAFALNTHAHGIMMGPWYKLVLSKYRELPLISSRLNFVRNFVGLINGGAYIRGGLYTRGLITGIKNRFETSYSSVDRNKFFIYWVLIKI